MRRHFLDSPISYYAIFIFVRYVPVRICRLLGRCVVSIIYAFSKKDRNGLSENLSLAFKRSKNDPIVKKMTRKIFHNYGEYMVDFFLLPQMPLKKVGNFFSDIRGEENLKEALVKGCGAILISAHLGNWEIGSILMRLLNYPLAVTALPHNTEAANALVNRLRTKNRIKVFEINNSTFSGIEIFRYLKNNGIVAMIGDRDYFGAGLEIQFMGGVARLPTGPIALAMHSGAALIPTFVLKNQEGKYSGIMEKPVPLVSGKTRDEALLVNLKRTAGVLEQYIRRFPDQWYCPDPISSSIKKRRKS